MVDLPAPEPPEQQIRQRRGGQHSPNLAPATAGEHRDGGASQSDHDSSQPCRIQRIRVVNPVQLAVKLRRSDPFRHLIAEFLQHRDPVSINPRFGNLDHFGAKHSTAFHRHGQRRERDRRRDVSQPEGLGGTPHELSNPERTGAGAEHHSPRPSHSVSPKDQMPGFQGVLELLIAVALGVWLIHGR